MGVKDTVQLSRFGKVDLWVLLQAEYSVTARRVAYAITLGIICVLTVIQQNNLQNMNSQNHYCSKE